MASVNRENEGDNVARLDAHRIRQTEALLSALYREDVRPKLRMPNVSGIKLLLNLSLLAIVAFSVTLFYEYNYFIYLREDVLSKSGNLNAAVQRRADLFGNLVNVTLNHASLEHSVFSTTAKLRSEILDRTKLPEAAAVEPPKNENEAEAQDKQPDKNQKAAKEDQVGKKQPLDLKKIMEALTSGGGDLRESLGRLLAVVEQYPNIQSAQTYHQLMVSLVDIENQILTRRVEFDESLRQYNTAISKYPWSLLAEWTGFVRLNYVIADASAAGGPVITGNIYKQLLPFDPPAENAK